MKFTDIVKLKTLIVIFKESNNTLTNNILKLYIFYQKIGLLINYLTGNSFSSYHEYLVILNSVIDDHSHYYDIIFFRTAGTL